MKKFVEYAVYYDIGEPGDGDVDHVTWREARRLVKNPPDDVMAVYRVTRWWADDERLVRQEEEVLFSRDSSYGNPGEVILS